MSRRTFSHEGLKVVVGWDNQLCSFFIMISGEAKDKSLEPNVTMFRGMGYGANLGEIFTKVETIESALAGVGITIPDAIKAELLEDQAGSPPPKIAPGAQAMLDIISRDRPLH